MAFFTQKAPEKYLSGQIFPPENYFFEITQSKYIWFHIKNVILEKLIFGQKSQFTLYQKQSNTVSNSNSH
jgi:hypothetical protein